MHEESYEEAPMGPDSDDEELPVPSSSSVMTSSSDYLTRGVDATSKPRSLQEILMMKTQGDSIVQQSPKTMYSSSLQRFEESDYPSPTDNEDQTGADADHDSSDEEPEMECFSQTVPIVIDDSSFSHVFGAAISKNLASPDKPPPSPPSKSVRFGDTITESDRSNYDEDDSNRSSGTLKMENENLSRDLKQALQQKEMYYVTYTKQINQLKSDLKAASEKAMEEERKCALEEQKNRALMLNNSDRDTEKDSVEKQMATQQEVAYNLKQELGTTKTELNRLKMEISRLTRDYETESAEKKELKVTLQKDSKGHEMKLKLLGRTHHTHYTHHTCISVGLEWPTPSVYHLQPSSRSAAVQ